MREKQEYWFWMIAIRIRKLLFTQDVLFFISDIFWRPNYTSYHGRFEIKTNESLYKIHVHWSQVFYSNHDANLLVKLQL